MKRVLILAVVFVSFFGISKAEGNIGLHVGASVPTGEFGSDNSDYGGGATTGFSVGLKYFIPLSSLPGMSLTLGADYLNNGLDQASKDQLKQSMNTSGVSNVVINYMDFVNIPVLVGLNHKQPINRSMDVFEEASLGINYSDITDLVITYKAEDTAGKSTLSFTPLNRLVYQFGAGVLINTHYTVGLHYNLLGIYSFAAKYSQETAGYSQSNNVATTMNVNISMVTLDLGIRF